MKRIETGPIHKTGAPHSVEDKSRKSVGGRIGAGKKPHAYLVAFLCFFSCLLLACRAGADLPDSSEIGSYNAYWNCPTPSPVPTHCWQEPYTGTPTGFGTPTPEPIM